MPYLSTPCRSLMYLMESLRISDLLSFLSSGCVGSSLRSSANAPLTCCCRNRSLGQYSFFAIDEYSRLGLVPSLPMVARTLSDSVKGQSIWSVDGRNRVRHRARMVSPVARRSECDSKSNFNWKRPNLKSHISAGGGGSGSGDLAAGMTLMAGPAVDATVLVSKLPPP